MIDVPPSPLSLGSHDLIRVFGCARAHPARGDRNRGQYCQSDEEEDIMPADKKAQTRALWYVQPSFEGCDGYCTDTRLRIKIFVRLPLYARSDMDDCIRSGT